MAFWNKYMDKFSNELSQYVYYSIGDSIKKTAYNAALFYKGLLLNTDIEMRKLLLESGDANIIREYNDFLANQAMIAKLRERYKKRTDINVDSLKRVINQQEAYLIDHSKVYGDYTRNLRKNWQDVRFSLKEKEIAIEFLSFTLHDSTKYIALTLKNNYNVPHMIPLFEQSQLKSMMNGSNLINDSLSAIIWKPLNEELYGIETIYFSPSGELHNIGIEYLPEMDSYKFIRLSSTREICNMHGDKHSTMSVLYGGLDYSLTNVGQTDKVASQGTMRGAIEEIVPLPGSKKEVKTIENLMKEKGIQVMLKMGTEGTEESFKSMSGQKPMILHLSTHGFYKQKENMSNLEQSLSYSGLLLAGAEDYLNGDGMYEVTEDGILTAREIASTDLRDTQLVVLSACETALGDITGEGVFGLQRGFKKAGVNSILMSLWKVDDEATCLFMTEFYRGWICYGKTKYDSLKQAIQEVRSHKEKGWDNPKYWATFILLDGID